MGLRNIFRKQLASVIEWKPQPANLLLHRYPSSTEEIKNASKLIIGPGQGCILVYEGKVSDVLNEQGTYNIRTDNHPFITSLLKISQNFESEHKVALFYYRKADVLNQGWGTSSPIKYIDQEYGIPVELSAYGNFSYVLKDPQRLLTELVGTEDDYSTMAFKDVMQGRISDGLRSYLAISELPFTKIDTQLANISQALSEQLHTEYEKLGMTLTDFRIESTSFDEHTMKRIGEVADITSGTKAAAEAGLSYAELEKLRALRDAAKNEGGGFAAAGIGLGAGVEMGKLFTEKTNEALEKGDDPYQQLKKLKILLDENILTKEEYKEKKKEILAKI